MSMKYEYALLLCSALFKGRAACKNSDKQAFAEGNPPRSLNSSKSFQPKFYYFSVCLVLRHSLSEFSVGENGL